MSRIIRVGTRESLLAVQQTMLIIQQIQQQYPAFSFEVVKLKTSGDLILDRALDQIGGKGLFIKEIEAALLERKIDFAVHSLKDIPEQIAPDLALAAISAREDPRDVLITRQGGGLADLPPGSLVGTSSLRRQVQLLEQRPDLAVGLLRGNVITRLDKLTKGHYAAIVLAAAGLNRLGLAERVTQYFRVDEMIPAVGQGMLAVQTRAGETAEYGLESVHCGIAADCARAERAFLLQLNGGCSAPIGAHATIDGTKLTIQGMLAIPEQNRIFRDKVSGAPAQAVRLGELLAERLKAQAGRGEA